MENDEDEMAGQTIREEISEINAQFIKDEFKQGLLTFFRPITFVAAAVGHLLGPSRPKGQHPDKSNLKL